MKKKLVIILVIVGLLVIVAGIGYYWWWQNQPENMIVIKDTPEGKLVINRKEGISMKVPEGWKVKKYVSDEVLEIQKFGPNQIIDTELQDGIVIDLYIDENPKELEVKDWLLQNTDYSVDELNSEKINGINIVKTLEKASYGLDEYQKPVFIENSGVLGIDFAKNKKIYHFSCTAVGVNYQKYLIECEEIIQNKILNEF